MFEYVKLFGGPFDGRQENVMRGVNSLRMKPPLPPFPVTDRPGEVDNSPAPLVVYRRSKSDPSRFVYEGPEE